MKAFLSYLIANRFELISRDFQTEHVLILSREQVDDVLGPGLMFGSDLFEPREIEVEETDGGARYEFTGRVAALERIEGPEPKFKFTVVTSKKVEA